MSSDCKSRLLVNVVAVESSVLAQVAYDDQRAVLHVTFRGGATYLYSGVPRQAYRDLLAAQSKGTFFNRHIRNVFPCAGGRSESSDPPNRLG